MKGDRRHITVTVLSAALLIGVASLFSCSTQSPEAGAKDYFVRTTYDREGDCDAPDSVCAKVDFIFPAPTPKMPQPLAEAFESAVRELIVTPSVNGRPERYDTLSITQLSQHIMAQFEQMQADFPDAASTRRLFEEQLVAVVGDTLGVITLKRTARAYTGGAHSNEVVALVMLDRATGSWLTLDEVIEPDAFDSLKALVEAGFREARGLAPDSDLAAAGFVFGDREFALPENIGFNAKGLVCYYNNYEVTSYAAGPTEVVIPWQRIGPLLARN